MAKSKFFRVAVEGATASDGRTIEKSWIQDMAAGYNATTYGARVNLEHVRGVTGQSPFKALGDVLALKAEPVTLTIAGKQEQRLALYAQIDPTADLQALTKDRQKIYTSIEVATNFANTGKAGLVGLAVTDTPASLGTEALAFSARTDDAYATVLKAALDAKKTDKANLFSAAEETTIELEPEGSADDGKTTFAELMTAAKAFFTGTAPAAEKPATITPAAAAPANTEAAAAFTAALDKFGEGMNAAVQKVAGSVAALETKLAGLETKLNTTDVDPTRRTPSPGAGGSFASVDY